jgi:hypothetical protein
MEKIRKTGFVCPKPWKLSSGVYRVTQRHSIPCRVFSVLEPDLLRHCLHEHGKGILDLFSEKQICLDGKKLRGVNPGSRGNLKTLIKIEPTRFVKNRQMQEIRHYISDEEGFRAAYFNALDRGHWSIENSFALASGCDFQGRPFSCQKGQCPWKPLYNLSTLRKLALQIIKEHNDKLSLKKRRLKAAYQTEYLRKLIA